MGEGELLSPGVLEKLWLEFHISQQHLTWAGGGGGERGLSCCPPGRLQDLEKEGGVYLISEERKWLLPLTLHPHAGVYDGFHLNM